MTFFMHKISTIQSQKTGPTELEKAINLAGVEIILNMREKMDAMQREFEQFIAYLREHAGEITQQVETFSSSEALIPISKKRYPQKPE